MATGSSTRWQTAIGGASLAARAIGASGRMLGDRVGDALGRALPRSPAQLARPEVLDHLLRHGRPEGAAELPPVRAAKLPGVEFESSNCRNFLIEVEWEGDRDSQGRPLPRTLYAKLPCDDRATRVFANAVGFWATEAAFCARVASSVPIRVPRVYAVAERGARFVLLLENLGEDPSAQLFLNRDMAVGTTFERAERVLDALADLHAKFWGWGPAERAELVPDELHTFLAPRRRALTRAMNAAAIAPAHRAAPALFTAEHAAMCRMLIEKWDAVLRVWYAEPLTLIHGDSHLGNCFEYRSADDPPEAPLRVGMLDFQGMHWCGALRDVQYFLIDSLEPERLAQHEAGLIERYCAALARHGIELSVARAREQYRAFVLQTLMVAVVPLGMGALTERENTLMTVLERALAAVDRWRLREWLMTLD